MTKGYSEFYSMVKKGDREGCLEWAISRLRSGELDVVTLYRGILAPTLGESDCTETEISCIFTEHLRTSILRTIVENAYPFVIAQREKRQGAGKGKRVLVTSPKDEYHDLATRMAADLFAIAGFEVMFLGSNTPSKVVVAAAEEFRPQIISFTVMNYYHIATTGVEIKDIREKFGTSVKIVVGGSAFENNPGAGLEIGADRVLRNFEEIEKFAKGG